MDPNSNITSDIPHELKLLIRVLLSQDPEKRPSCEEILPQLRQMRPHNGNSHNNNARRRSSFHASPSMMKNEPPVLGMGSKIQALPMEEEPRPSGMAAPNIQSLPIDESEDTPEHPETASVSDPMDVDPQRNSEKRDAPGANQEGHKKRRTDHNWLMLSDATPALPSGKTVGKTPHWLSSSLNDIGYMGAVKTATAILKVSQEEEPCGS